MLSVTLDTSCCIDVYRQDAMPDGALLTVLNYALLNRVDVATSDVAMEDIEGATPDKRPLYERRLNMFPRVNATPMELGTRDALADELFHALFPGSPTGSGSHDNNLRDCRHLATHRLRKRDIFVTLDKRLLGKAAVAHDMFDITIADPGYALEKAQAANGPLAPRSVVVRPYREDDDNYVRATLTSLGKEWLVDSIRGRESSLTIGELEGDRAALAFCEARGNASVELSALYVDPKASATDLGGHLLFSLVRSWIESGYETAWVTVLPNPLVVSMLRDQGFLPSGLRRRLDSGDVGEIEFVKYLERDRLDERQYPNFAPKVARIFSPPLSLIGAVPELELLPFAEEGVSSTYVAETGSITLTTNRSGATRTLMPADLEITFYPLRVAVSGRRALIIPIQRQWATRMMPFVGRQEELFQGSQDSLFIRSDNVYYCYPKCQHEVESRSSIIFYISAPVSAAIGEAKIRQWALDLPEVLHAMFGGIGVYDLAQVRAHVKDVGQHLGQALALRFSHYVPFPFPVALSDLREILDQDKMTPQGLHPVSIEAFEKIRAKGGLDW